MDKKEQIELEQEKKDEVLKLKNKLEKLQEPSNTSKRYSKLGNAQIKVEVLDTGYAEILPAKIVNNYWLEFTYRGSKKRIIIMGEPRVMEYTSNFIFFTRRYRTLLFHTSIDSSFTLNPQAYELNLKQVKIAIKTADVLIQQDIGGALAKAVRGPKSWLDYLPWFVVCIITVTAFWFMNEISGK